MNSPRDAHNVNRSTVADCSSVDRQNPDALRRNVTPTMAELRKFIEHLCRSAGQIIVPYFSDPALAVTLKDDRSPVTRADTEAEAAMRRIINETYPDHGIIGEEFGNEREDAEFVWFLDPVDGTITFTCGTPLFGTLVGLRHNGRAILGAIAQPVLQWYCIGDTSLTTINGRPCSMRHDVPLEDARLFLTDPLGVERYQPASAPTFERLMREVKLVRTWGDCFGYLLLAQGLGEIMLDPIMNPWDIMALIPIIRGAGGTITDWHGAPPETGRSCIAASRTLHPAILERLNSC